MVRQVSLQTSIKREVEGIKEHAMFMEPLDRARIPEGTRANF